MAARNGFTNQLRKSLRNPSKEEASYLFPLFAEQIQ